MYGLPLPCPYLSRYFSRQPENQPSYHIHKEIPVYLGGEPGTEKIVIYTSNIEMSSLVQIQKYDKASSQWMVEYQKEAKGIPFFDVLNGYLEAVRKNVVVIYYVAGSGGFLNYTVLARRKGKIVVTVNRINIFQGDVWLDSGKLYEQYSNRYRVWTVRNGQLALVPYQVPIMQGALVIRYGIDHSGNVKINKKEFAVPVGAIVQIIRTDLNDTTERVLYSFTPVVKYLKHRSGFKFLEKGMIEVTIIPEGYDWSKAVNIIVESR